HCAATTIAIIKPGNIGVARDLLGHGSLHTTNSYYNKARSIEASRLYARVLTGLTPDHPQDQEADSRNGLLPAQSRAQWLGCRATVRPPILVLVYAFKP